MNTNPGRSVHQIVEDQVRSWRMEPRRQQNGGAGRTVVTISREPGSGGRTVAQRLAKALDWDLFDKEIISRVAESANMSTTIIETLDDKDQSILSHWIAGLVSRQHLWPDQYQQHLMRVIGTIGRHGRAVILGRGANFILPHETCVRVRVVAPRDLRITGVANWFRSTEDEAEKRIARSELNQKAFARQFFNADIEDPTQYDLVLNTGSLGMDGAVDVIRDFVVAQNHRVQEQPRIRPG